jgi:tetratricopeptide (TPR) repeat protein
MDLLNSRPSDPGLKRELARAHHRVGEIQSMLGRPEEAQRQLEQAIEMLQQMQGGTSQAQLPAAADLRQDLAMVHNSLAEVLRQTGQSPETVEQHYRIALALQQPPAAGTAGRPRELARSHNNLGILLTDTGRYAEAQAAFSQAIQQLSRTSIPQAEDFGRQADLARSYINLGVLLRKQKNIADAEQAYRDAIAVLGRLAEQHPNDRDQQYRSAISRLDLANLILEETARPGDAEPYCRQANATLLALTTSFPGIPRYCRELANSYISLGNVQARLNQPDEAQQSFEQARAHLDDLQDRFPEIVPREAGYHSLRGITLGGLGYLALQRGATEEASHLVQQAVDAQRVAAQIEPQNPEYHRRLQQHYVFLAQILRQLGQGERAREIERIAEETSR